jgi:hypothetical protein
MEDSQGDHKSYFTLEREKLESHLKAISLQISEMKLQRASSDQQSEEEEYYNEEEDFDEQTEEVKYSISPTESKAP